MTTPQPHLPFDPRPAPSKRRRHKNHRVTTASVLSFEEAKTHRNKSYLMILELLAEFDHDRPEALLTAREMLRIFKIRGQVGTGAERNRVSPKLSGLLDLECVINPTLIEGDEEVYFLKRVDGDAAASVWKITDKGEELLNCLRQLHAEVKR